MAKSSLPSFREPPLIELAIGVQFKPSSEFTNGHLGAFWQNLRRKDANDKLCDYTWSKASDAHWLQPVTERFDDDSGWSDVPQRIRLKRDPAARLWIRNEPGDAMIQVQNGRLHFNWIANQGSPYPRFDNVIPSFLALVDRFREFMAVESLGEFTANQWELTYVNHIPQGPLWQSAEDWPKVVPGLLSPPRAAPNLECEGVDAAWHFQIAPRVGRLHIELRRAKDSDDHEVIQLNLTARGPIAASDNAAIQKSLEKGREAIVFTFDTITSQEAHKHWGRNDDQRSD